MFANLVFDAVITQLNWPLGSALSIILLIVLSVVVSIYNRLVGIGQLAKVFSEAAMTTSFWLRLYTIAVYLFMFLPIVVVVLLAFNANQFGTFPMEGLSLRWFIRLWENDAIMRAFRVSLLLASLAAIISTTLGVLAALSLVRYRFKGKEGITTLLIAQF